MRGGADIKHITVKVTGDSLNIYPVCDVQVGAHGVDKDAFQEYIATAAADPVGHIIGVGDYTDGVSPSNRKLLMASFVKGELYDVARDMLDGAAEEQAMVFQAIVQPTVGKWDAVLGGHHYWEYQPRNNQIANTDMDIAKFVGAPYVEAASLAVVSYVFDKKSVLRVLVTHGLGGTSTFAGPLNQLEKLMRAFDAQVYIVGHHHKLVAARAVKLEEDAKAPTKLRATDSVLVGAGSWLRGYMADEVTYAEAGLMVPLATGAPIIRVTKRPNGSFKVRCEI